MADPIYQDRQRLDIFRGGVLPDVEEAMIQLVAAIGRHPDHASLGNLPFEAYLVASLAAGCSHCQAHCAYDLHKKGVDKERIHDLWDFERSDRFTEADRAVLRFARDAGTVPNAVTPQHFVDLRAHFTNTQIALLLVIVGFSGFTNRYNDSLAVVTDAESADWAVENLRDVGWELGKHAGSVEEQRFMYPFSDSTGRLGIRNGSPA